MDYDVIVVGGGAGGLGAARAAVRRRAKTLLLHHGPLGGECTFTGCVPSKALIEAAGRGASFTETMDVLRQAVATIAATESAEVLRREGIEVLQGWATFTAPGHVDVDGRTVSGGRFILATGTRPVVPALDGLARIDYLTNENVFSIETLPASLAVLGGGAIGVELAQGLARLGSKVTVVEAVDRLLAKEEPETSAVVADALVAEGVSLRLGCRVTRVEKADGVARVRLVLDQGEPVVADQLLVSVGRSAVTTGMGLEVVGIETDERGFIRTDDRLATTADNVWAVGDVAGKLQFTHAADEMGRIAASNALSRWRRRSFRTAAIPWVTYTSPEVGRVGMTEAEAAGRGGRVAYLPMTEVDRAVVAGQTRGFVKLVAGPRPGLGHTGGGRLLGATMVAARGGEMVHEAALAIRTGMFTGRLAQTVHAYPTWSLAVQKAASQFFVEVEGRRAYPARSEP